MTEEFIEFMDILNSANPQLKEKLKAMQLIQGLTDFDVYTLAMNDPELKANILNLMDLKLKVSEQEEEILRL
jgi:hypothetical protein